MLKLFQLLHDANSVPHTRPQTPRFVTHYHDEDDEIEDGSDGNNSDPEKKQ